MRKSLEYGSTDDALARPGVSSLGLTEPGRGGDGRLDEVGDARLVERARGGDDAAFAALVTRYERKLIRVLARLVRDEELARDLAQETFWKVYNRLDRFDTARRFGPWLFRVGVNLGLDWLRRREAPAAASIDGNLGEGRRALDLPDPDPRLQAEVAQEVQFILERVPVAYRTILVLRDLEGFSSAEVAAIVGRREATVRWRLAKAREMFREHWERRQDGTRREATYGRSSL
ncbi:MAG: sigma-70 family RNA polymerase sigma factor [Isosphaeraceae bacterium]|nr:sigma-70 family RNA polymerase sigma factor [Isosphaeraceae bacterium]